MFDILKIRKKQGWQYIKDVKKAEVSSEFRGMPKINVKSIPDYFNADEICPVGAIDKKDFGIDMGTCIFCGDCMRAVQDKEIEFTNIHKLATDSREKLIIRHGDTFESYDKDAIVVKKEIKRIFGRSLKLRQVSAGGCGGCEFELNACSNVNFDMGRYGIDFVASPRHADGLVVTGPVTENMVNALEDTYKAIPAPKLIIAAGTCAISGGLFKDSPAVNRSFFDNHKVDVFIPGCPVHPLTFINGILKVMGRY